MTEPAQPFELDGLDDLSRAVIHLILRITGGDFAARGAVRGTGDASDAVIVALNMLAESFGRERAGRERAEALLADAVDAYDHAPDWFCSCEGDDLHIVKCNLTMANALGQPTAALLGRSLLDLVAPTSREVMGQATMRLATTGAVAGTEIEFLGPAAASPFLTSLSGTLRRGEAAQPDRMRLTIRDVTGQRQLETALMRAQRMEALGRLAGGVAHDFNNLLLVILMATDSLARQLVGRPDELEEIGVAREAAERAAMLTKDLLAFARQESSPSATTAVDDAITATQSVIARLIGTVSLALELGAGAARVGLDQGRLGQVLVNLAVNARDAMPCGGRITITSRRHALAADDLRDRPHLAPGDYVELAVADTGEGIPPAVRDRIFEPFFTTKPVGKGTGLGLATVYGLIQQAGGYIRVDSELGRGTTFVVNLPVVGDRARPTATPVSRGARSLLLIEDDPLVRGLTARILRDAGYAVLEASDGASAIELARGQRGVIELIVSDVVMPGMDGIEAVHALRQLLGEVPCLFVTAYSPQQGRASAVPRAAVLEKPFSPAALLAGVRALGATVGATAPQSPNG